MRTFSLDKRLSLCASYVREGSLLVDVGTDHAYLPCYLLLNHKISSAIATDINEGPLSKGKECAEKYYLSDKIDFLLCDGLEKVRNDNSDDIVIAGMGGELIRDIIKRWSFSKDSHKHFILQPMTKYNVLIEYLYSNGFEIIKQDIAKCDNKIYTVILAKYTGKTSSHNECDFYIGKLNLDNHLSLDFLNNTIYHLENQAKGDESKKALITSIRKEIQNATTKIN